MDFTFTFTLSDGTIDSLRGTSGTEIIKRYLQLRGPAILSGVGLAEIKINGRDLEKGILTEITRTLLAQNKTPEDLNLDAAMQLASI